MDKQIDKQKQQKEDDLSWIKKMTEDAQNKVFDIEKKIIAKDQGGQPEALKKPSAPQQKPIAARAVSAREPPQAKQQEIKKVMPSARQES